jgi:sugar/nucleoside kinase (ribokinase family)
MAQNNKKVVVAGHICLDITPVFSNQKPGKLETLLVPGKLIHMEEADVHTGGSVANTGLAMKRLGADVKLMGKVGQDAFGKMVGSMLKEYDADGGLIIDPKSTTSYSVVIAAPGVDRIFLHHPGANDTFSNEDISDELLDGVSLFHFGYPPIMKRMYEKQGQELVTLFQRMKVKGIITSLDMAAVDASSDAGRQDWKLILSKVLPYVDFFLPSAEELCFMLDPERFQSWMERADGKDITEILRVEEDIKPLGKQLIELGAKVVLIKCGALGIYYRTAQTERLEVLAKLIPDYSSWSNRSGFEASYLPERVRSATGAGDTTIAAFLTAVLLEYPLEKCLQLATATGASSVTEYDALSGLKSFSELEEKIKKGWSKRPC